MGREFIAHSTKALHFPVGLSTSASSHHDLSLAAFITNIVESGFPVHTTAPIAAACQSFLDNVIAECGCT
jgi:hypothetical protein